MAFATAYNPITKKRKKVRIGDPNAFAGGFQLSNRVRENNVQGGAEGIAPVEDTSQSDLIAKIVAQLYPQSTPPPAFEASGLYNEADVTAQGLADYQPTFDTENQRLQTSQQGALRGLNQQYDVSQRNLGQSQQQQTGNQLSDYYSRGLSKSGGLIGAQQQLGQNQAYDTNMMAGNRAFDTNALTQNQGYDTAALGQQQKSTLAGVKNTAYQNAFQRYLAQFRT